MENSSVFELIRSAELLNNETIIRFSKLFNQPIGISQILVLYELQEKGTLMQSVLAKTLGYTPAAMTNIANKLVKGEYAKRVYDSGDRRTVLLDITAAGTVVLKRAQEAGQEMRREMYSVLDEEEIGQMLQIQKKLHRHMAEKNLE